MVKIKINGEEKTIAEIAKEAGLAPEVVRKRWKRGVPTEHLGDPVKTAKSVNIRGVMLTFAEAAEVLGIKESTLRSRDRIGLPLEAHKYAMWGNDAPAKDGYTVEELFSLFCNFAETAESKEQEERILADFMGRGKVDKDVRRLATEFRRRCYEQT